MTYCPELGCTRPLGHNGDHGNGSHAWPRNDGEIEIVRVAIRTSKDGWIGGTIVNGRLRRGALGPRDRDGALAVADYEAREEADRYVGNWKITIIDGADVDP